MGRPRTPMGSFGDVWCSDGDAPYKARVRYRGRDGKVRTMSRFGDTKAAAKRALKAALADWQARDAPLDANMNIEALAAVWLVEVDADTDKAAQTREHYTYAVDRYVKPQLGKVGITEASTSVVDAALKRITTKHGPSAAKTARAVLNGMFGYATRHDLIGVNPVREAAPIRVPRKPPKHLTPEQVDEMTDQLRSDDRAVRLDLPDLVDTMLGTGARIGEACALRDGVFDAAAVDINATVIRLKGKGLLVQLKPKSAAGNRTLALPGYVVAMLDRRRTEERLQPRVVRFLHGDGRTISEQGGVWVALASPTSMSLRDPSNTPGDLRAALDRLGWGWVTSHTFRKTVATRMDEAGCSAREIADQLGHSEVSLAQNVYLGRKVVSSVAAQVLDR